MKVNVKIYYEDGRFIEGICDHSVNNGDTLNLYNFKNITELECLEAHGLINSSSVFSSLVDIDIESEYKRMKDEDKNHSKRK